MNATWRSCGLFAEEFFFEDIEEFLDEATDLVDLVVFVEEVETVVFTVAKELIEEEDVLLLILLGAGIDLLMGLFFGLILFFDFCFRASANFSFSSVMI